MNLTDKLDMVLAAMDDIEMDVAKLIAQRDELAAALGHEQLCRICGDDGCSSCSDCTARAALEKLK